MKIEQAQNDNMHTVTAQDVFILVNALEEVMQAELYLPAAVKLRELYVNLSNIKAEFVQRRNNLIIKYGEETAAHDGNYEVKPENMDVYKEDMAKLSDKEVSVLFAPLAIDELGCDKLKLSTVTNLMWVLKC